MASYEAKNKKERREKWKEINKWRWNFVWEEDRKKKNLTKNLQKTDVIPWKTIQKQIKETLKLKETSEKGQRFHWIKKLKKRERRKTRRKWVNREKQMTYLGREWNGESPGIFWSKILEKVRENRSWDSSKKNRTALASMSIVKNTSTTLPAADVTGTP